MPARKTPPRKTTAPSRGKSSAAKPTRRGTAAASDLAVVLDANAKPKVRAASAWRLSGEELCASKSNFRAALGLVRDAATPAEVRYAVLSALQSAAFGADRFASHRPDYMTALRALRNDADLEVRQRAFGILARENDGNTQTLLLEGLEHPAKALLPPEKALQLLSYDVHAGAFDAARKIADKPPNEVARREALRVLAADARSADMFEKILRSKSEPAQIRSVAAAALHQLAPQRLQQCARDIALDESEADALRALGLNALANFGDAKAMAGDTALNAYLDRVQKQAADKPSPLGNLAAQYSKRRAQ